jgi:hypothetical protein
MSNPKPITFDDNDFDVPPQKRKRSSTLIWVLLGFGALAVIVVAILFFTARRAAMMRMAEAEQARAESPVLKMRAVNELKADPRREHPEGATGPSPGGISNVLPQLLTHAKLSSISLKDSLAWDFEGEQFVLHAEGKPLPTDLVKELTGSEKPVYRLEGKWRLERDNRTLVLQIDGRERSEEVKLAMEPVGPMNVTMLGVQYRITESQP